MTDSIIICIPTFKRPKMLKRLLDAIALLKTQAAISVLVADNDAEAHAGFDLCGSLTDYRWPLRAVIAEKRGIAQVRNTLIEQALKSDAQFIAMIDDDEWPQDDWIDQFLITARASGADVLQGSILFGFGEAADGHGDIRRPTGPVAMLQGAGNILIRRAVLEDMQAPWFDPEFALSGGEDRDFFVRLERAGKRFAWSDEARAHGDVPETRANLGWLLRRAYSVGNSDMLVLLKHRPSLPRLALEVLKIMASLLLSPLAAVILAASPNRRAIPLQKLFRAVGKLSAMAGTRYNEYAVVHGE
ncbi:MAG TPA: glycosyltransferase family 2 protein [Rhizomicrobium sp.]|jgi:succinoglycan biosynthesis protein ExoM|nr:glycosyltransferase family 2 protein [Rhizomicrobium sp.]